MVRPLKKIKKNIRLHSEGTTTLILFGVCSALLSLLIGYTFSFQSPFFWSVVVLLGAVYLIVINFFRCPIRIFDGDTEGLVLAPADGKIVVVEEVDENEYFHDRRLMISIFMSLFNVHANWIPVDGTIKMVRHYDGNFHRAWLPKASEENERCTVVIATPDGTEILARQIAGAMARRIVTYPHEGDSCFVDEHLGFIKFGSRVDLFLPLGTEVCVKLGNKTVGNETVIAHLKPASEPDGNDNLS